MTLIIGNEHKHRSVKKILDRRGLSFVEVMVARKGDIDKSLRETFSARMMVHK
ncbi:MAG: hypothetical protein HQL25_09040 [Candidatus Omnitrophica bacterium]|nr:hypothetical protein [Candidatus Omnitrophota bacterium]